MRKLIYILLFIPYGLFADNLYVSNIGNNSTGDGSIETPWATLSYACTQAIANDVIIVMNDITDNNRAVLPIRVSVLGIGTPTITTSYPAANASDAYLYLYSSSLTNGNQSISYIEISGNSRTSTRAIWVGYRYNVSIHHCNIHDFERSGVHFRNQVGWQTPPSTYATGNSFYNNTIINCSDQNYEDSGLLRIDGQSGFLCYNNYMNQSTRATGHNGKLIDWSFVKKTKIYDNTFIKNDPPTAAISGVNTWNFAMELWNATGDNEIYDNTFTGRASVDLAGNLNSIAGDCTFGVKVYGNKFLNSSLAPVGYHIAPAIIIEGTDWSYVYVYNNQIQRFGLGIEVGTSDLPGFVQNFNMRHIYIYNNIIDNVGYSNYSYSYGIWFINEVVTDGGSTQTSNVFVYNNTITSQTGYHGVSMTMLGPVTNFYMSNNIIYDFSQYPIHINKRSADYLNISDADFTYNDFYSNGTNSVYLASGIITSAFDRTTGNVTVNPEFISSADFRLSEGSDVVAQGISIAWLTTDYLGNEWADPPSMGAYEYAYPVIPPIVVDYPSKFLQISNRFIILNNRFLKIE